MPCSVVCFASSFLQIYCSFPRFVRHLHWDEVWALTQPFQSTTCLPPCTFLDLLQCLGSLLCCSTHFHCNFTDLQMENLVPFSGILWNGSPLMIPYMSHSRPCEIYFSASHSKHPVFSFIHLRMSVLEPFFQISERIIKAIICKMSFITKVFNIHAWRNLDVVLGIFWISHIVLLFCKVIFKEDRSQV